MNLCITDFDLSSESFKNDFRGLPGQVKDHFKERYKLLLQRPQPKKLRLEKLGGYSKPGIYTIHITPNHSHKLSFELIGSTAKFRRIGTHKLIDRTP